MKLSPLADSATPEVVREAHDRERLKSSYLTDVIRTLFHSETLYRVICHFGFGGFRIQNEHGEVSVSESSVGFLRIVRTALSRKKIDVSSMTEPQVRAFSSDLDVAILSKSRTTSIILFSDPAREMWDKKIYHVTYMFVGLLQRLTREYALATKAENGQKFPIVVFVPSSFRVCRS